MGYARWVRRLAAALLCLAACGEDRPYFQSVNAPGDTTDTAGPYLVEAHVVAERGVREVLLRLSPAVGLEHTTELQAAREEAQGDVELWRAWLPGRPVGTRFLFHLVAIDRGGQKATYPDDWPESALTFAVVSP